MKSVLFVCSGNIFRSVTAERALSREIVKRGVKDKVVSESAGTHTAGAVMRSDLMQAWKNHCLSSANPVPRQVTHELLERASVVIAMGLDHQEFIWREFRWPTYLFNQLAYGKQEPVLDVCEVMDHERNYSRAATKYIEDTVRYIITATPALFQNLDRILG